MNALPRPRIIRLDTELQEILIIVTENHPENGRPFGEVLVSAEENSGAFWGSAAWRYDTSGRIEFLPCHNFKPAELEAVAALIHCAVNLHTITKL